MQADTAKENHEGPGGRGRRLRRALFAFIYAAILLGIPLGLGELAYRYQWVDTYGPELRAYNPPGVLTGGQAGPTLLALGDSFTAGTDSYPDALRRLLPGWRIVNGGISGTGIVQANFVAPGRLRQFRPAVCVYQLYAGNDLFDLRYPAGGTHVSPARRIYWFLASHLRVLSFVNYRLGQGRAGPTAAGAPAPAGPAPAEVFAPHRYDPRERRYFEAEPAILENQVRVLPARAGDYARLLQGLAQLHATCRRAGCPLVLLVIPHAAQVAPVYLDRMRQMGATFSAPERMAELDYPFLAGLRRAFAAAGADVSVVDPLPVLRASEQAGTPVYFANDGHLNRAGQDRVAHVLAEAIQGRPPANTADKMARNVVK